MNAQSRAHYLVRRAVVAGDIPAPTTLRCVDCGKPARQYDHRDYREPLNVDPVCRGCNVRRGSAVGFDPATSGRKIVSVGVAESDFELIAQTARRLGLSVSAFMVRAGVEKAARRAQSEAAA